MRSSGATGVGVVKFTAEHTMEGGIWLLGNRLKKNDDRVIKWYTDAYHGLLRYGP